jgi:hypothetical protein
MERHGDTWCGEVSHVTCFFEPAAPVLLTMGIGKKISPREERIRGGLKYSWKNGISGGPMTRTSNVSVVP